MAAAIIIIAVIVVIVLVLRHKRGQQKEWSLGFLSPYLWYLRIIAMIIHKLGQQFCESILLVLSYTYINEQFSLMQPNIPQATENFLAAP